MKGEGEEKGKERRDTEGKRMERGNGQGERKEGKEEGKKKKRQERERKGGKERGKEGRTIKLLGTSRRHKGK